MATAYSGEVSVGTYNRIRIKCDYSGTSATCTVQFRRTQAYSGYWGDSRATLTFNGATKNAGYSYSGTAGTNWINLVTVSGYSVSTSGGTYNWNFSNPGGGVLGCSGTIVIGSQGSAPSDLAISLVEATWNSVTMETTVGNWGTGTNWQREAYLLEVPYVAGVDKYRAGSTGNTTQPVMLTVGTQSIFEFSNNPFVVYGCKEYYTGLWASTTVGATRLQGPTFYTAPCKLDSLTYTSETFDGSTITATIAAKTNSTWNKSGATVGFLYQVSTDGGETFDGWKDLSTTATVGTTANLSIPNLQPGTAYVVEVAQICMDADIKYSSESSFVNFTTKKYRKTYGPGASGYVTSTFTDDAKHTVENTADHTLLGYSLLGKTEQATVTTSESKNLMPLSPVTGAAVSWAQQCSYEYVWDDEIKQTVLHMWCSASQTYPGLGFSISNYNIAKNKNYAISARYKMTSNRTGVNYGAIDLNGRNNWEPLGSTTNTGIKIINGNHNGTNFYPSNELIASGKWEESTIFVSKDAAEWSSYTPNQIVVCMLSNNSGWQSDLWISDIMIEEITDAQYSANTFTPVFTPYTAKQVAPTPDAPMPVKTVTGRQTFKITGANGAEQEYEINLGKNLLNIPDLDTTGYGLHFVCKDGVLSITGATGDTYYPSIRFYADGSYVVGAWYPTASNIDTSKGYFLDKWEMGTFSARAIGDSTYTINHVDETTAYNDKDKITGSQFITVDGKRRVNLWSICFQPNKTINLKLKLQFEKGPEATSWSPYFTPVELNKLDTYQDKIYRNSGKWYVHKETDKLTVVPNDLSGLSTHSGSFVTVNLVKSEIMQNSSAIITTASENFVGATMTQTWNNQVSNSVSQATNGHYLQFCLPNSAGTTLDAVKTYFTNRPTDVRYVLTTATDTEITYAPLIEQLETLRKLGHTSVDATTFDRNGYGNATVGLEVKTADSALVTKQFRKLYGAKPAKKNLLDVPLNFTVTNSNRYKSVPVTLESGKTYTYSAQEITTDSATEFLMLPINGSSAVGDGVKLTPTTKSITFTMPGDAEKVYIYSSKNWADSGSHTTTFHGLMIEEGDKATTYQAYSDGGKAGKAKKIKKLYGPAPAQVNLIHVGPLTQITHTQTSNSLVSTKKRLTCEEVNVSGTSTSNWSNFGPQYSVNWPAGTYTLTVDHPLPFDIVLRTTGAGDKVLAKGKTSYTFTTTATATAYYFFNDNYSSGTTFNETFKIQLVKGSTPDYDFKLYSDGTNANTTKLIYND